MINVKKNKCCGNCQYWRTDLDPDQYEECLQCDFSFNETRYDDYCSAFTPNLDGLIKRRSTND